MADVARRGRVVDTWSVVDRCQQLVMRPQGARAVEHTLAAARITNRRLRRRIRRGIEAHVARGDRENLATNLYLALPLRVAPMWRTSWRHVGWVAPIVVAVFFAAWTRSWYLGVSAYGWSVLAATVGAAISGAARRRPRTKLAAWQELDRIRIMASRGDVTAAMTVWHRLAKWVPTEQAVADAIADAACAIEGFAHATLAPRDREALAAGLRAVLPFTSLDCDAVAVDALRRLEARGTGA